MQMKYRPAREVLAAQWAAARSRNPSAFDRFMAKVEKRSSSECWPNTFVCKSKVEPYGHVSVDGKKTRCSRFMYSMFYGEIPRGMCVMHVCDNPPCVNPAHLRLATHHENMLDRMRKNRGGNRFGERNGRAKISEDDVRAIRASPLSSKELGKQYGLTSTAISYIKIARTWRHIK